MGDVEQVCGKCGEPGSEENPVVILPSGPRCYRCFGGKDDMKTPAAGKSARGPACAGCAKTGAETTLMQVGDGPWLCPKCFRGRAEAAIQRMKKERAMGRKGGDLGLREREELEQLGVGERLTLSTLGEDNPNASLEQMFQGALAEALRWRAENAGVDDEKAVAIPMTVYVFGDQRLGYEVRPMRCPKVPAQLSFVFHATDGLRTYKAGRGPKNRDLVKETV